MCPPTLERVDCLPYWVHKFKYQSTHPFFDRHTQIKYLPNKWLPVIQLSWHIKLTTTASFGIPKASESLVISQNQILQAGKDSSYCLVEKGRETHGVQVTWNIPLNFSEPGSLPWLGLRVTPGSLLVSNATSGWPTDSQVWKAGLHSLQVYQVASWVWVTIWW